MANPITFTGEHSESFEPNAAFQISVHGATARTISVKTLPTNIADSGDWIDADVVTTGDTLTSNRRLVIVNFAKGYKYRLETDSGNIESTASFYWGDVTTQLWVYASG